MPFLLLDPVWGHSRVFANQKFNSNTPAVLVRVPMMPMAPAMPI
jgi:hypothetical protein